MEQTLYYRVSDVDSRKVEQKGSSLVMRQGASISFDTYFNVFPFCKFRKYTRVDSVGVCLQAEGSFTFRLFALHLSTGNKMDRSLLQEKEITCTGNADVSLWQDFSTLPDEGVLYFEIAALSEEAKFYGGCFAAADTVLQNRVKVACVICTYKREPFVYRNIENVTRKIDNDLESHIRSNIDFFIVDNGHTIESSKVKNEHVFIFPNKNWGGSGGFTRGIIEACRKPEKYTHVLLMDDDILFEPEVLARTEAFLEVLKPEYGEYILAAGMLEEDRPWVQYEAGGVWKGRFASLLRADLDLRSPVQILRNEMESDAHYCGWWYQCIPLAVPKRFGLPFPFFIKADDVEYCIRSGSRLIFIGGVGVWHKTFSGKMTPFLQYYLKRNDLILNALHFPEYGKWHSLIKLLLALGKQTFKYNFSGVDYLFAAYLDFLKGPDFFLRTDAEDLNRRLGEVGRIKQKHPFFHMCLGFFRTAVGILSGYEGTVKKYRSRLGELTSFDFWCSRLEIEPVQPWKRDPEGIREDTDAHV